MNHNNALLQLNIKATGFMVSEDFFSVFPHYKDHLGMAKLNPKGHVGTIYARDQKTLLYNKYINYGSHRKDFYIFFPLQVFENY